LTRRVVQEGKGLWVEPGSGMQGIRKREEFEGMRALEATHR
jgi:hypothetical protein